MSMVRMSITIPEDLAQKLDQIAGSRKKSEFITESLKERIQKMEQEKLQNELADGCACSEQGFVSGRKVVGGITRPQAGIEIQVRSVERQSVSHDIRWASRLDARLIVPNRGIGPNKRTR